jgi:hypothetical protein
MMHCEDFARIRQNPLGMGGWVVDFFFFTASTPLVLFEPNPVRKCIPWRYVFGEGKVEINLRLLKK